MCNYYKKLKKIKRANHVAKCLICHGQKKRTILYELNNSSNPKEIIGHLKAVF